MIVPRLSAIEQYILSQIALGDRYGRQLVIDSRGRLDIKAIYVQLSRMVDKRLIEGGTERVIAPDGKSGPPRRMYRLTARGRRTLAAYAAGEAMWRSTAAR